MVQKNKKFSDFKKTRKNDQKFNDFQDYRKTKKNNRSFNEFGKTEKKNRSFNEFGKFEKKNRSFNEFGKPKKKYNPLDDFKKYVLLKKKRKMKNYNLKYRKFNRSNRPPKRDKHQITRYLYRQVKLRKGVFLKIPAIQEIVYPFKLNLKLINEYLKKK